MKKIKTIIISILLFFIVPIISSFLLEKIPSIYYDCSPSFPDMNSVGCMTSSWGLAIPLILGLGVAVWYLYRNLSSTNSNKKTKKAKD